MKILLINDHGTMTGGAEKILFETKRLLEEENHEVRILTAEKERNSQLTRWYSKYYYNKAKEIIEEFKPDLVHVHNCTRAISPSPILAAKKKGVPILMTVHDFGLYCPKTWAIYEDGKPCQFGFSSKCLTSKCKASIEGIKAYPYHLMKWTKIGIHREILQKNVDLFLCPSQTLTEYMKRTFPKSNIQYLQNFCDIKNELTNKEEKERKDFLFVGRLNKEKGITTLLLALSELLKEYPKTKLKIAGEGEEKENILTLAKKLNIEKNLIFIGRVNPKELNLHYSQALAVIVPSIWMEAFGLVTIESLRNKTPAIVNDVGGLADLAEEFEHITKYTYNDKEELKEKMKEALNQKKSSSKEWEKDMKTLQKYSEENYKQSLLEVYSSLLQE